MPSHSCPDGYFWNTETLTCELIPGVPLGTPATPILVSQDPVTGVVLSSGVWDSGVTGVYLFRSDVVGPLHLFTSDSDDYTDVTALTPTTYTYYTKARNGWGSGLTPSANLVVNTKTTNLTVVLTITKNGTPAIGIVRIVADISGSDTLDSTNPFALLINNVSQTVIQNPTNDHQFYFEYDSVAGRWAGDLEIKGIAKNNVNVKSAPAISTVAVDNSFYFTTRWQIFVRQATSIISRVGTYALLLPEKSDPSDLLYEFRVISPIPTTPTTEEEFESVFRKAQKIKLKSVVSLNGTANDDGTYTVPSDSMWLIGKEIRPEALTYYDLHANIALKIRSLGVDSKIIIATDSLKIYLFDIAGMNPIADGSNILTSLADSIDACYVSSNEVHTVMGDKIYIADLDSGDLSETSIPIYNGVEETLLPVKVETVNSKAYWIFSDDTATRVYRFDYPQSKYQFTFSNSCNYSYTNGEVLILVSTTHLYQWKNNALLSYTHSQNITGAQITEADKLQFVDSTGKIYELNDALTVSTLIGDISLQGNALGRFQGAAPVTAGAAGGENNHLFIQDKDNVWASTDIAFETGATIDALERIILTIVEGVGNPLMGGTAPVFTEGLLIGVTKAASAGAYIAQYQSVNQTAFQYRAQGVTDIIFKEK